MKKILIKGTTNLGLLTTQFTEFGKVVKYNLLIYSKFSLYCHCIQVLQKIYCRTYITNKLLTYPPQGSLT